mgnify:CR=1 FL=1
MHTCRFFFFFQAEDGIRDLVRSRGLGDVYKRQLSKHKVATVKTSSEAPPGSVPALQRHTLNGETMGTRYSAVFFAPANINLGAIGTALFAAVDQVDRQMSTWKPDSDLNRLNAVPLHQWHAVPAELLAVLDTAVRVGIESRGAFDIGVGELVNAWGFGPTGQQPQAQQIRVLGQRTQRAASAVLEAASYTHLTLPTSDLV